LVVAMKAEATTVAETMKMEFLATVKRLLTSHRYRRMRQWIG
jgi:hypothetical protein